MKYTLIKNCDHEYRIYSRRRPYEDQHMSRPVLSLESIKSVCSKCANVHLIKNYKRYYHFEIKFRSLRSIYSGLHCFEKFKFHQIDNNCAYGFTLYAFNLFISTTTFIGEIKK